MCTRAAVVDVCCCALERDTEAVRAGSFEFTNAARLGEHGKTSRH